MTIRIEMAILLGAMQHVADQLRELRKEPPKHLLVMVKSMSKRIAIATIFDRLDRGICANCALRVFAERRSLPLPVIAGTPTSAP